MWRTAYRFNGLEIGPGSLMETIGRLIGHGSPDASEISQLIPVLETIGYKLYSRGDSGPFFDSLSVGGSQRADTLVAESPSVGNREIRLLID